MADEYFEIANPLNDPYDTTTYAKGKHKRYYNPDTKRYRVMENKDYSKLWIATDLYKLTNGDNNLIAYIIYLLQSINYDNAITRYDKHLKARVQVRNREELAEVLHIKYSSGSSRNKIKQLIDMNIVFEARVKLNNCPPFNVYYLSPLIGMKNKGLSLDCYMFFRDILINVLPKRTVDNLDRHVLEIYGNNDIQILSENMSILGTNSPDFVPNTDSQKCPWSLGITRFLAIFLRKDYILYYNICFRKTTLDNSATIWYIIPWVKTLQKCHENLS